MNSAPRKGGRFARSAAMLCQAKEFRLYLDRRRRAKFGMDIEDGTHTEQDAKDFIYQVCGVSSRKEIDHNPVALQNFKYLFFCYRKYLKRNGITPEGWTR